MFEKLIKCAIISSRIIRIIDEKLSREVRPTLNLFIKKPFGFGFSTMARELEKLGLANYINDFSIAGIVGSVRGGRLYEGSLASSGYKLTIFDEVMMLDSKAKKAILELTESGTVSRDLQGFVEREYRKDITGGYYTVGRGKLRLEIHTSCVFGTASDAYLQDPDIKMLLSRCFCLHIGMSVEEALRLKREGRTIDIDSKIIPEEPVDKVVLPEEVNDLLLEKMQEDTRVDEEEGGYYTRCHDDMIRLSAVHCVARGDTVISEKDVKFALQFYPLHQLGYQGVQVSTTSLKILEACRGLSVKELSKKLGIPERTIRYHMQKLIELRLVARVGNKYFRVSPF